MKQSFSVNNSEKIESQTVLGSRLPNFFELVSEGAFLPPLPYSISYSISRRATYTQIIDRGSYWNWTHLEKYPIEYNVLPVNTAQEWLGGEPPVVLNMISDFLRKQDNKILAKLKGQSLPVLMMLKERKETGHMLLSFLDKSVSACRVIRHPTQVFRVFRGRGPSASERRRLSKIGRRIAAMRRSGRSVGDAFLQYQFAWKPFISDILSMMSGLESAIKKAHSSHVTTCKTTSGNLTEVARSGSWNVKEIAFDADFSIVDKQCIYYLIDDASAALWSQFQDPLAVAWDSVPWSFIIDWAVNISKYLDLRNSVSGVKFSTGYRSTKTITNYYPRILYPNIASWACPPWCKLTFQRQILTSFPEPTLEFPLEDAITGLHLADMAALLNQKFSRKL